MAIRLVCRAVKSFLSRRVVCDDTRITSDSEAEDAQTVLRTLMLKTFRPSLPCYVQLHHSHNRVQLHMLKKQRVTCIEELKMSILGLSALYVPSLFSAMPWSH